MDLPRVASWLESVFSGPDGDCARLVLSWTLAGGIAGGGLLIGSLDAAGVGTPGLYLLLAPALFLLGTATGSVHAMVLGIAGRPAGACRWTAFRRQLLAVAVALPLLGVSWMVSSAITVGVAVDGSSGLGLLVVAGVGWIIGLAFCAWAACEGWRVASRAFQRCPNRYLGVLLSIGGAGLSSVLLAEFGTELPGLGRNLAWRRAVPIAIALTVWLWVPVVYLVLHELGRGAVSSPDLRLPG